MLGCTFNEHVLACPVEPALCVAQCASLLMAKGRCELHTVVAGAPAPSAAPRASSASARASVCHEGGAAVRACARARSGTCRDGVGQGLARGELQVAAGAGSACVQLLVASREGQHASARFAAHEPIAGTSLPECGHLSIAGCFWRHVRRPSCVFVGQQRAGG